MEVEFILFFKKIIGESLCYGIKKHHGNPGMGVRVRSNDLGGKFPPLAALTGGHDMIVNAVAVEEGEGSPPRVASSGWDGR